MHVYTKILYMYMDCIFVQISLDIMLLGLLLDISLLYLNVVTATGEQV